MENRNHNNRQVDLFAPDPQRMQWENLANNERYQIQCLLAQLVFSLFSYLFKLQNNKEHCHAAENNI
jgi:hypothetical protein